LRSHETFRLLEINRGMAQDSTCLPSGTHVCVKGKRQAMQFRLPGLATKLPQAPPNPKQREWKGEEIEKEKENKKSRGEGG
jgi:hypothetical protein